MSEIEDLFNGGTHIQRLRSMRSFCFASALKSTNLVLGTGVTLALGLDVTGIDYYVYMRFFVTQLEPEEPQ